jgi:hypothetical protein
VSSGQWTAPLFSSPKGACPAPQSWATGAGASYQSPGQRSIGTKMKVGLRMLWSPFGLPEGQTLEFGHLERREPGPCIRARPLAVPPMRRKEWGF